MAACRPSNSLYRFQVVSASTSASPLVMEGRARRSSSWYCTMLRPAIVASWYDGSEMAAPDSGCDSSSDAVSDFILLDSVEEEEEEEAAAGGGGAT